MTENEEIFQKMRIKIDIFFNFLVMYFILIKSFYREILPIYYSNKRRKNHFNILNSH